MESDERSSTTATVVDNNDFEIGKKRKECGDPIIFGILQENNKKHKPNPDSNDVLLFGEGDEESKDMDGDENMKISPKKIKKTSSKQKLVNFF